MRINSSSVLLLGVGLVAWGLFTVPEETDIATDLEPVTLVAGSVYDGDTIRVRDRAGEELRVRSACIDAPEMDQQYGVESRDSLRAMLDQTDGLYLNITNTDRWVRVIAEKWGEIDGELVLIQLLQVQRGDVFPYPQYKRDCPSWAQIEASAEVAQANQVGVWGISGIIPPWEHRN